MTHRSFEDRDGRRWEVWDVHPATMERRSVERRQVASGPGLLLERRRTADRRQRHVPRPLFNSRLNDGWLCFESDGCRRRHAPIPPQWADWDARRLEECCRNATPVTRRMAG